MGDLLGRPHQATTPKELPMSARKLMFITAILSLTSTGIAYADDVGPDQAIKLRKEGKIQPFDKLNEAALAKHPGATVEETELEKERGGYVYEVELRDTKGVEWKVKLDAASGEIISDRQDD
jgi:uncharacterized membrane protein YkoI